MRSWTGSARRAAWCATATQAEIDGSQRAHLRPRILRLHGAARRLLVCGFAVCGDASRAASTSTSCATATPCTASSTTAAIENVFTHPHHQQGPARARFSPAATGLPNAVIDSDTPRSTCEAEEVKTVVVRVRDPGGRRSTAARISRHRAQALDEPAAHGHEPRPILCRALRHSTELDMNDAETDKPGTGYPDHVAGRRAARRRGDRRHHHHGPDPAAPGSRDRTTHPARAGPCSTGNARIRWLRRPIDAVADPRRRLLPLRRAAGAAARAAVRRACAARRCRCAVRGAGPPRNSSRELGLEDFYRFRTAPSLKPGEPPTPNGRPTTSPQLLDQRSRRAEARRPLRRAAHRRHDLRGLQLAGHAASLQQSPGWCAASASTPPPAAPASSGTTGRCKLSQLLAVIAELGYRPHVAAAGDGRRARSRTSGAPC